MAAGGANRQRLQYVFAAATPYPAQYPNAHNPHQYYQYPGYYPPPAAMPVPLPAPYDHHHYHPWAAGGRYPCGPVKQILWVNGMRYELQEIYGIGNTVDDGDDDDGSGDTSDPRKECLICLSEPRDTTVLPCPHMCMCSGCAKVLRFQTNRCPICRQLIERLLEIKVNNSGVE